MARDQTAVTGGEVVLPAQIFVGTSTARPISRESYNAVGLAGEESVKGMPRR